MTSIPLHNIDERAVDEAPWHVASLVVHVAPAYVPALAQWLAIQPGAKIHTQSPRGKFAVVVECDREQGVLDLMDRVQQQPGTLGAALIYHEIVEREDDAP